MDKERYRQAILSATLKFIDLVSKGGFTQEVRRQIMDIRQYILPTDDMKMQSVHDIGQFGHISAGGESSVNTLNPTPYEAIKKSTAGFLAFHHTPFEDFFRTKIIPQEVISDMEVQDSMLRYWNYRDKRTHSIMQQSHNIMQEVLFIAERLAFNLSAKTLDFDDGLQVKKTHHRVENIILFSSDGVNPDIVGVIEDLNWFQYKMRFPKQITPMDEHNLRLYSEAYDFTVGFDRNRENERGSDVRVYRINLPVNVYNTFMQAVLIEQGEDVVRAWNAEFSKQHTLKGGEILDIMMNEFGQIIEMVARTHRTVIVGHLGFVTKDGVRGKSQGDMAVTTSKVLQETEEILMDAYERSFGPTWAMPSALQEQIYGIMSRNDVLFTDDSDAIRPLTLDVDLNTAKNLAVAWEERINRLMFLDVFSLVEKNRMPVSEISMRRADGFKQLGLYVAADMAYNLEPEVLAIMRMDEEKNEIRPPPEVAATLKVNFISPIVQAIKSTTLDEYGRIVAVLKGIEELQEGNVDKNVNCGQMIADVLHKTDHLDALNPADIRAAKEKLEANKRELEVQAMRNQAESASNDNLLKLKEGLSGDREQQEAGGAAPGAQGTV